MPGEEPNANDDATASTDKLQTALAAEREAHKESKRKHAEFVASVRKSVALPDDADPSTIVASLGTRLGDLDSQVTSRTAALAAEVAAQTAKAAEIESKWSAEKIESALLAAWSKSGANDAHREDFLTLGRAAFTLGADGRVVTKADAAGIMPGASPEAWIHGQLKNIRPAYWPTSTGGGARGGNADTSMLVGMDVFDPRSPAFNITKQFAMEATHGSAWAERARARFAAYRQGVLR